MQIGRIRVKKGQRRNLSQTKKIQNIVKNIFQNKIKQIKKNLLQNEFNQIAEMPGQSRDELERITKIRRIKNYEEMTKEELIISLLKSKQSIAELFNNNLFDNNISDIRRILNRL